MAIVRDPTTTEIAHFLSTRSGYEMVQLVRSIQAPGAQAALAKALLEVPRATVATVKVVAKTEKTKKALNAFVGFRCYYISMVPLKAWPMKKLSHIMGQLWEADSNKTLWSLMAKAWSAIRDQIGKENAPLDTFFDIVCPLLNIPAPNLYLAFQGWELGMNEEGAPTVQRDLAASPTPPPNHALDIALSVEDIISYCKTQEYAHGFDYSANTTSPTFLGRSLPETAGKGESAQQVAQPVMSTQAARAAMKNMRRARRETARQTGAISRLQEQIAAAHVTDAETRLYGTDDTFSFEQNNFVDSFNSLLASKIVEYGNMSMYPSPGILGGPNEVEHTGTTIAQTDDMPELHDSADTNNSNTSLADLLMTNDSDIMGLTNMTDWNAFRTGADENITLPTFDLASI